MKHSSLLFLLLVFVAVANAGNFIKSKKEIDNFFVLTPIIKFIVPQTLVIPDKYKYYKWEINKLRNPNASMVQVSEFLFYDKDGNKILISGSDVTNPNGNNPTYGSGTWSLVSGSGNIVDPTNRSSLVTSLGLGINRFKWTIDYKGCTSFDEVDIESTCFLRGDVWFSWLASGLIYAMSKEELVLKIEILTISDALAV